MVRIIRRYGYIIAVAVLVAISLPACVSSPPVQEMSDARQAIKAAQKAQAVRHAPLIWYEARRLILDASKELEAGNYEKARRDAMAAKQQAQEAMRVALSTERTDKQAM